MVISRATVIITVRPVRSGINSTNTFPPCFLEFHQGPAVLGLLITCLNCRGCRLRPARQWELAQASSPCLIDKRNRVRAGSCATTRLRQQRKTYHPPWFDTRELESGGIDGWWWEEMWICGGRGPTRLAEAQSVPHVWAESLPTQGGPRGLAGIVKVSCKRM